MIKVYIKFGKKFVKYVCVIEEHSNNYKTFKSFIFDFDESDQEKKFNNLTTLTEMRKIVFEDSNYLESNFTELKNDIDKYLNTLNIV